MARLRAHLRDEVRNRAGRAARDWLKRLSDLTVLPVQARSHSEAGSAGAIPPANFSGSVPKQKTPASRGLFC
ncbi:hypothetical protein CKF42_06575 [Pantoea sp. ARC270]|nr:hypothetical protein CKF42_06575 [Pantoea sp. ARC270]